MPGSTEHRNASHGYTTMKAAHQAETVAGLIIDTVLEMKREM